MEGGDGGGEIDSRRPDSAAECEEMETDVPPSVRKRKMEDQPMEDEPEEEEEEEVIRACVIEGSKHADGSIYRQDTHFCHRDYWLNDTRETPMKPRIFVDPVTKKIVTESISLHGCALMQIFSLKLTNHSAIAPAAAGPIMLYGFVAARDLLLPLRNYVFNRTRDDPLVLHRDPDDPSSPLPIQMASPKRAICLQARAMIEYDLRIKRAATEEDDDEDKDLHLIDGAATFSERTPFHGTYTSRICGDHGAAVDVTLALLRHAVEARIQVSVTRVPAAGLSFSLSCYSSRIAHEIELFDGVVDRPGNIKQGSGDVVRSSFVVAVVHKSPLILCFKVAKAGGGGDDAQNGGGGAAGQSQTHMRGYPARGRGSSWDCIPLDFGLGSIQLQISWSNLD